MQKNNNSNRFFIKTLGCKVNQYESQAMREILLKSGFKECLSKEMADIYILNTCTVTQRADSESRYWAGMLHKTNPSARIIITGCGVEKSSDFFLLLPGVTNIVKNDEKNRILEVIKGPSPVPDRTDGTQDALSGTGTRDELSITSFKDHTKAFVKIQDGCGNFCAYCKVPYVRGASRSRPIEKISEEVKTLVANGFKEIVLTGICLGAWGERLSEKKSIVDVLKALDNIRDIFRIRLSSIEPKYVTDELIEYMASNNKICRHLHIPIQSGDDDILHKMNRPYTAQEIRDIIIKARNKIRDIGVTTDVLIGFPGESDFNFRNTVRLIKDIMPVRTHIFPFSKREGTAAYSMPSTVSENEIRKRFQSLKTASITASYLFREKFLNNTLDVLVESRREKNSGHLTGYTDNYIKVMFDGPDSLMRTIVPVRIEELNLTYTFGSIFS